jgi:hypothetical protein
MYNLEMTTLDQIGSDPITARLIRVLRVVIALQCIGLAGMYWFSRFEVESDVYGILFFEYGWPEATAQLVDDFGVIACFIAGWVLLIGRFLQRTSACFVAIWMLTLAITHSVRGGLYSELAFGEHAVRYAAPLASLLLTPSNGVTGSARIRRSMAIWLLLIATSATFAVHGYKAIGPSAQFVDLIVLTCTNLGVASWTGLEVQQSTVEQLLLLIGVLDLVVAGLLFLPRKRIPLIYMVIWGTVTAASRMTAMGLEAWPETLIRSANWGCPLALLLYFSTVNPKPSRPDSKRHP